MVNTTDQSLLDALLDAWDRNNTILLGLLRALPGGALNTRAMDSSPTFAQLFTHMHSVRLALVAEDAPEFSQGTPEEEWEDEHDPERIAQLLVSSAQVVKSAVRGRTEAGQDMDLHYDHPVLLLQHLIWHEGYHHGQIKLALKLAGHPWTDQQAGPGTWGVWMRKTGAT
jgi:uncharacterized damage-inducible protein DinB